MTRLIIALPLLAATLALAQEPATTPEDATPAPAKIAEDARLRGENLQLRINTMSLEEQILIERVQKIREDRPALQRQLAKHALEVVKSQGKDPAKASVNWVTGEIVERSP